MIEWTKNGMQIGAAVLCVLGGLCDAANAGDVYTAQASADASVAQGQPTTNFGSENVLVVGEASGEWRGFIRWDFVGPGMVPQGSKIESVSVQLYRQCTSATTGIFMELGVVNEDWSEGSVRWGNRPTDIDPISTYPVSSCSGGAQWITLADNTGDLRDKIQELVNAGVSGYGIELKSSPLVSDAYQLIRSREDSAPRLVIEYSPVEQDPDLAVTEITSDPGPILLCEPDFHVDVSVQNLGTAVASGGVVRIKLRTSSSCTGAQQIYTHALPDIAPGASLTEPITVPIPGNLNRQDYYIFADVSVPDDADASNNCEHTDERVAFEVCFADLTNDCTLDVFDVFAFLDLFKAGDDAADMTDDGELDIFDVFAYLDLFALGCP